MQGPLPSSASLYKLSCCGRRGLLAAIRADAERLAITVTVPPGKVVLEAWAAGRVGYLHDRESSCRVLLAAEELPLTRDVGVPLDTALVAVLLSGVLPASARAVAEAPGWVEWESNGVWARASVSGPSPRVTAVRSGRVGDRGVRLEASLGAFRGTVPGEVELEVDGRKAHLELLSRQDAKAVEAPPWMAEPTCVGAP